MLSDIVQKNTTPVLGLSGAQRRMALQHQEKARATWKHKYEIGTLSSFDCPQDAK